MNRTDVADLLATVDARPTTAAHTAAARRIAELTADDDRTRIALVTSFTVDPLVPYLTVEAARAGFAVDVHVAPFDQIHQELRSPAGPTAASRPDVVFVGQLLETAAPRLWDAFPALTADEIATLGDGVVADLVASVRAFREHSDAEVVVHDFVVPTHPALGIAERATRPNQTETVRRLGADLAEALAGIPGVAVLGFDRCCAGVGYTRWRDDRMWDAARAPLTAEALRALAVEQVRFLVASRGQPAKCLVVDLDGTLWGGVVGEVGVGGIALGDAWPGSPYHRFQKALLALRDRGVLLAISSKNNPADVDEVFDTHPDLLVRREDFAAARINWDPKPVSLAAIAAELSIGVDSLVFVDDNPAERLAVRAALPEVTVLEVPEDPSRYADLVLGCGRFDRVGVTDEDRARAEMYRQQAERRDLASAAGSVGDYLAQLAMTAEVRPVDGLTTRRVVDLLGKTNQFNVTTRRHSAADLQRFLDDPAAGVFSVRVTDRFGDNGIVGVLILVHDTATDVVTIDTLLLSCRVIGRTVETALLAFADEWTRSRGAAALEGTFVPTAKNAPAADVFARHGFVAVAPGPGAVRVDADGERWRRPVDEGVIAWPAEIARDQGAP